MTFQGVTDVTLDKLKYRYFQIQVEDILRQWELPTWTTYSKSEVFNTTCSQIQILQCFGFILKLISFFQVDYTQ